MQQGVGLRDDLPSGLRQGARRFRGTFTLHVGSQRGSEGGGEFVIPGTEKATGDDELAGPQGQSFDASSRLRKDTEGEAQTGEPPARQSHWRSAYQKARAVNTIAKTAVHV